LALTAIGHSPSDLDAAGDVPDARLCFMLFFMR
jgi:hypothetical protein